MIDREKIIQGLKFIKAMITFNPLTGEDIEPEDLNEDDKRTYDACVGAIALLKERETIVKCKDCKNRVNGYCHNRKSDRINFGASVADDWFCGDGVGTCSCENCGTTVGYYSAGCSVPEKLCKYCPECGHKIKWEGLIR